jgi:hypothetical protein
VPTEPTGPTPPTEPLAQTAPPTTEASIAPVALAETGLPEVSVGPRVRLQSTLPITTRQLGSRHIPSVTLASPTAQTNLDAWFESQAWCRGRVQLAIDGFVSYTCSYSEPAAGGGVARAAMNVRITQSGEVESVPAADVFVPGTDVNAMIRVWANDPRAPLGEVAFGPAGAVVVPSDVNGDLLHLPWRTIAPYVRRDGPLGAVLTAQTLSLPPPGATAPPSPLATTALLFGDAGHAMQIAARLPPAVRAEVRLRVSSDESALLLPPGADRSAFDLPADARSATRYFFGPLAELVSVRLASPIEIHQGVGPRTPVIEALPAGAVVVAARGPIGARTSELGTGWVLLAGAYGAGGYVPGRNLALEEGCGAPAGSRRGLGGYAALASPDEQFVWTLTSVDAGARTAVTLFPVDGDCAIGGQASRAVVEGTVTDLRVVRATADGLDWLLVVVTAADLEVPARTVLVFAPGADPPALYSMTYDAPVITLAERRRPDRTPGYFPLKISSGGARTWLSWNGRTIEPLADVVAR